MAKYKILPLVWVPPKTNAEINILERVILGNEKEKQILGGERSESGKGRS